ncbi:MAG: hypothetical protein QM744_04195 [Mesorhizobium sp.]
MPNADVPVDGEAMPEANISRRSFMKSIPPAIAVGSVVSIPAIAEAKEELPVTRVNRIAKELSKAMDEWMADLAVPGGPQTVMKAHVYPASYWPYPVMFEDMDRQRHDPKKTRSELDALIDVHKTAFDRWIAAADAEEAFSAEEREQPSEHYVAAKRKCSVASNEEDETLNAILAYRCMTMSEIATKAAYIRTTLKGCYLAHEQAELLLTSMIDEGAAL